MVSGTISPFCSKCFSPFLHSTGSLSVSREYLALPDGPGEFTQDSSCPALLRVPLRRRMLRVSGCHALWPHFPVRSARIQTSDVAALLPRGRLDGRGLGSSPFARHCWGNHYLFSFPAGTKMFQFPALASRYGGMSRLQRDGLSHSGTAGSRVICTSPAIFAAYRALRRLREPRHPPCALRYFPHARGASAPRDGSYFQLVLFYFVSRLLQHVKDLQSPPRRGTVWRITDSNR